MGSQIEQIIWFTVWCEGTTSLDFAQAFEKPVQMSVSWKRPRTAAEMEIVNGPDGAPSCALLSADQHGDHRSIHTATQ